MLVQARGLSGPHHQLRLPASLWRAVLLPALLLARARPAPPMAITSSTRQPPTAAAASGKRASERVTPPSSACCCCCLLTWLAAHLPACLPAVCVSVVCLAAAGTAARVQLRLERWVWRGGARLPYGPLGAWRCHRRAVLLQARLLPLATNTTNHTKQHHQEDEPLLAGKGVGLHTVTEPSPLGAD